MTFAVLALSLLFGSPQDLLEKRVDYETTAKASKQVLTELTDLTGVALLPSGVTERETLVLTAKDVPLRDLMKRIADVCNAEWKEEVAGFRLVRPERLVREEQRREREIRLAVSQQVLQELKDQMAKAGPWNADSAARQVMQWINLVNSGVQDLAWRRIRSIADQLPLRRATAEILASFDAKTLAEILPETRVVFSNRPNPMQRQLPTSANRAVQNLLRMQGEYAAALARLEFEEESHRFYDGDLPVSLTKPLKQPAEVLVIVNPAANGRGFRAESILLDEGGGVLGRSGMFPLAPRPSAAAPEAKAAQEEPAEILTLSTLARAFFEAVRRSATLPGEIAAFFTRPEQTDPLSLTPSEALKALAIHKKRNLVASIPDEMFGLYYEPPEQLQPSRLEQLLRAQAIVDVSDDGGWITVEARMPTYGRRSRTDRGGLGNFVRAILRKGWPSLDDRAAHALSYEGGWMNIGGSLEQLLSTRPRGFEDGGVTSLLRIYALFDSGQRQRFFNGAPHPISILTPEQLKELVKLVYHFDWPHNALTLRGGDELVQKGFLEPTELLPRGIPRDTTVAISVLRDDVAMPTPDPQRPQSGPGLMTAEALGEHMASRERLDLFPALVNQPDIKRVTLAKRATVNFRFRFTPSVWGEMALLELDPQSGQAVDLLAVPATFRKAMMDAYEKERAALKDMKPEQVQDGATSRRKDPPSPTR